MWLNKFLNSLVNWMKLKKSKPLNYEINLITSLLGRVVCTVLSLYYYVSHPLNHSTCIVKIAELLWFLIPKIKIKTTFQTKDKNRFLCRRILKSSVNSMWNFCLKKCFNSSYNNVRTSRYRIHTFSITYLIHVGHLIWGGEWGLSAPFELFRTWRDFHKFATIEHYS